MIQSLGQKKIVEKLHIAYYAPWYLHFCQHFEITIFAEILNIVAKFGNDSIFSADIFGKLSIKYGRNFRCRNTSCGKNCKKVSKIVVPYGTNFLIIVKTVPKLYLLVYSTKYRTYSA